MPRSNARTAPHLLLAAFLLSSNVGCDDGWKARSQKNEGKFCVGPFEFPLDDDDDAGLTLEADTALTVHVRSTECLSGSCTRNTESRCEVHKNGQNLELTSEFRWEEIEGDCTLDCLQLIAECKTPALPAGDYTLRLDGRTLQLAIPGNLPDRCSNVLSGLD